MGNVTSDSISVGSHSVPFHQNRDGGRAQVREHVHGHLADRYPPQTRNAAASAITMARL